MARFDSATRLATRLIAKNGQQVELRHYDDAAVADNDQPWRKGQAGYTSSQPMAVFLNFSDLGREGERIAEGLEISQNDKLVLISGAALDKAPDLRDRLFRDADDEGWAIINVKTLDPNGQNVLFQLQVRQ